ncbi:MAG: NUDIX domain-containing protein [Rhodothermales bacterium]
MLKVLKACPCIVRDNRILAFVHPDGSFQIPKGSVEDHESIEEAVLRELAEESGIQTGTISDKIGEMDWLIEAGTTTYSRAQHQAWHIYLIDPGKSLPDNWQHKAVGSKAEEGLIFSYFWQPLDDRPEAFHPVYLQVIDMVEAHLNKF